MDEGGVASFPRQQGAAVWQHVGNATRGIVTAAMQEQGVRVLMEADDNYLVPFPLQDRLSDWQEDIDAKTDKSSYEAHRRISRWCDGIIVSTPELERAYRQHNQHVFLCPNSVDPDDWPAPQPYDGTLRIGYAGSDSHVADVHLIRRALTWASKQDGVTVMLMGIWPHQIGIKRSACVHIPWTDSLEDYRYNLGFFDIGLCPLVDNEWSRGKSDLKALEYGMGGALPIVSRTEPYRSWWEKETPCLVADSARDFEKAVQWAVRNRDETLRLAAEARTIVTAERNIRSSVWRWREAIEG